MNTVKFNNKGKIKMIAHRGVSGLERENTCAAFVAAGSRSYYGIETDVHVTKDKKHIIYHNDSIENSEGKTVAIRDSYFDDLRRLGFKDVDDKTEREDLMLPSLEEYLSICRKYEKVAVLELKENMEKDDVAAIGKTVADMGMMESTTFISFFPQNLLYLRAAYPSANAQFLSDGVKEETVRFILDNNFDADIYYEFVTKEFIDLMHANGRVVNVWTVDELADAEHLLELGVDMITSDIIE